MKKTKRQNSLGSTGCCSSIGKAGSHGSGEWKTEEQQTKVYLNSLELQAALTQQQTTLTKAEVSQLQTRLKTLTNNLELMKQRRKRNEALMIAQEGEVASLKMAATYVAGQSLPKRVEDTRKALEEQLGAFQDLVTARPVVLEQNQRATMKLDTSVVLDRVGELIVGQMKMHESRLQQKEQEIRVLVNRFQQELGFLSEAQSLLHSQIHDEIQVRAIELRKALKLTRHSLPPPRTHSVNGPRLLRR